MTDHDVRTYSGLRLIPAAVAMLDVDGDPVARAAVTIEQVQREGVGGRSWTDDEVTIDWTQLTNPQRSSTARRLAAFARSMLDGIPVDMREIDYFRRRRLTSSSNRAGARSPAASSAAAPLARTRRSGRGMSAMQPAFVSFALPARAIVHWAEQ
jgi:hypothetical protein